MYNSSAFSNVVVYMKLPFSTVLVVYKGGNHLGCGLFVIMIGGGHLFMQVQPMHMLSVLMISWNYLELLPHC